MPRFQMDNTQGYSQADLDALNRAFEAIMDNHADGWANDTSADRDLMFKSWQDRIAETLLARYDAGERGESLEC